MDDWQLLQAYASRGSEESFRVLVDRYAGMVYHAALRQMGDPQAAEEVAQTVFIALAQKAGRIPRQTVLCGWLFRAVRYAVLHLRREEDNRRRYEEKAVTMEPTVEAHEAETVWDRISPYLNDALDRLPRADRDVVMIRFFGNKSHKEVAQVLGLSEETAKKRLSRALEKLRVSFARRGMAVPSVALVAALSAYGAQAAPVGLTASISAAALVKGVAASPALAIAKCVLKLMAWAKAKTAVAVGAGVLLAAAGTATVVVEAARTAPDDLIGKLERQSGKRIAWDRHLALQSVLDLRNLPLEQALDDLSVHSGAYWTIDYAVYGSEQALRQLLNVLHEGTALETAGWTNLSARALRANIMVAASGNTMGGGFGGGFGGGGSGGGFGGGRGKRVVSDLVTMTVVLQADAAAKWQKQVQQNMERKARGDHGVNVLQTEESAIIQQAMNEGSADGVLAPERLLAETRLASGIDLTTPAPATAETAERTAKTAHARWATIFTLRKSPLEGAGIKLIHTGMENLYWGTQTNRTFDQFVQGSLTNRFNLSPEGRAAHHRAVEAYKNRN